MQVRDAMTKPVLIIGPDHTLRQAAQLMSARRVGSAVVVDPDSSGVGIMTERDVLNAIGAGLDPDTERTASHITWDVVYAGPNWTLAEAASALVGMEGLDRVLKPADYGPYGLPLPGSSPQAPDLVLSAKDGYAFSNETTGEEIVTQQRPTGSHGYLQSNSRLDALFVMGGRGVRKGAAVERVRNLDVAPTIAQLLGLRLENVEGAPLSELLERSR